MKPDHATVAIVDDDAAVCRALRRLLLSLGHSAEIFESGETLLEALGGAPPTHILLDLHMPGLHGPPLLHRIRAQAKGVQLIVMTGLELAGDREACLAAGADLFVRKPLKPTDLRRILGEIAHGESP